MKKVIYLSFFVSFLNTLFRLSGREPRLRSFSRANTASHPSIQLIDWICFFSPLLSFQKGNSLLRDMLRVKRRASGCRPMLTPTVKGHTSSQSLRLNNKHTHTHTHSRRTFSYASFIRLGSERISKRKIGT